MARVVVEGWVCVLISFHALHLAVRGGIGGVFLTRGARVAKKGRGSIDIHERIVHK